MELVKINHEEYGLQESKAKEISAMFKPMLNRMVELEDQFNEVIDLPVSEETCEKAHNLRLEYVKTRTGTAKVHKELKAFYLQGGRFVDGWKNAQLMASQGIEDKLSNIENHYAIQEKERIVKIQEKRAKVLKKFDLDIVPGNLGELDATMWNNYLTGTKVNYDKKKEEERKFLQEQVEKEEAHKKEEARIRKEGERLAEEARARKVEEEMRKKRMNELTDIGLMFNGKEFCYKDINVHWTEILTMTNVKFDKLMIRVKERMTVILKEEAGAEERARVEKLEQEDKLKEVEEKERLEREEKERKAEKVRAAERKKIDDQLKKQREEKEAAEAKLKAIEDFKERKRMEEEARVQAELSKGDADKFKDLISDMETLKTKYTFKSNVYKGKYSSVITLLDKIINYIS